MQCGGFGLKGEEWKKKLLLFSPIPLATKIFKIKFCSWLFLSSRLWGLGWFGLFWVIISSWIACFYTLRQPDHHIGSAKSMPLCTSINPIYPRINSWNFGKKILRIVRFFFASSLWKSVTNHMVESMRLNFYDYHCCWQCTSNR